VNYLYNLQPKTGTWPNIQKLNLSTLNRLLLQIQSITNPIITNHPHLAVRPYQENQHPKTQLNRNILQAIYNRDRGCLGRHHTQNTHWPEYTYPTSRNTANTTIPQQSTQTHGRDQYSSKSSINSTRNPIG
jgi:hypothetical protein